VNLEKKSKKHEGDARRYCENRMFRHGRLSGGFDKGAGGSPRGKWAVEIVKRLGHRGGGAQQGRRVTIKYALVYVGKKSKLYQKAQR
jgi:hypothetical protein